MRAHRVAPIAFLSLVALIGCSEPAKPVVGDDAGLRRRVLEPAPEPVSAVPPHEIQADGVGPYRLGASLKDVLTLRRRRPRVEVLQIEGLVDYTELVRAENSSIVIGVQRPKGVTFITVIDEEIAFTEKEAGVGSTADELLGKVGPLLIQRSEARDPRIRRHVTAPGLRFVMNADRVVAVVVMAGRDPSEGSEEPVEESSSCSAAVDMAGTADEILAAAGIGGGAGDLIVGCFSDQQPEAIAVVGDRIAAVIADGDTFRRVLQVAQPGLIFASPIDINGDGRDELVVVTRLDEPEAGGVAVAIHRLEPGRLVTLAQRQIYRMTTSSATWIGAKLSDIEFLVEIRAHRGAAEISGLYLHEDRGGARNVVPLNRVLLPVPKLRRVNDKKVDAGVPPG